MGFATFIFVIALRPSRERVNRISRVIPYRGGCGKTVCGSIPSRIAPEWNLVGVTPENQCR
ncbi:MAG: hypothetical protein LJE68_19760, partial [Rhodobacter sp.]|nr:hypothetical protein [Rhodobacter sp.]